MEELILREEGWEWHWPEEDHLMQEVKSGVHWLAEELILREVG